MWFTPHRETREDAKKRLIQRVVNITDVVSACKDSGYEWLEQLLENVSCHSVNGVIPIGTVKDCRQ